MSSNLLTLIVPLRDGATSNHLVHPRVDLLEIRGALPSIAAGFLDGICRATTEWVILANDDIVIAPLVAESPHLFTTTEHGMVHREATRPDGKDWVDLLEAAIGLLPDPYWLLYPDDGCFGERLSIFPVLNRMVVLEHLDLIPAFRRYCLDPHLFNIFTWLGRARYLPEIRFDHQNFYTAETMPAWAQGMTLNEGKGGRIYICRPGPDVDHDSALANRLYQDGTMTRVATALAGRIHEAKLTLARTSA